MKAIIREWQNRWISLKNFMNILYNSTNESYNKKVTESLYPAVRKILLYEVVTKNSTAKSVSMWKLTQLIAVSSTVRGLSYSVWHPKLSAITMDCLFYNLRRFRINVTRGGGGDIWPNEEEITEWWKRITHQWTSPISILHPISKEYR